MKTQQLPPAMEEAYKTLGSLIHEQQLILAKLQDELDSLKEKSRAPSIDDGYVLSGYQLIGTGHYRQSITKKEDKAAWIPLYRKV